MVSRKDNSARRGLIAALILAIGVSAGAETTAGKQGSLPAFGIGSYANTGYGTNGFSAVPGLSLLAGDFAIAGHVGFSEDILSMAGSLDWLAFDWPIWEFALFLVRGDQVSMADTRREGTRPGFSAWAAGLRAIIGARLVVLNSIEIYSNISPAYGLAFSESLTDLALERRHGDWRPLHPEF